MIEQKKYYLKRLSFMMIAFFILISCDLEHDVMNVGEIEASEVSSMQLRSGSGTGDSDVNNLVQDYIDNLRDVLYGVESFITDKNGYTNSNAENNAIDPTALAIETEKYLGTPYSSYFSFGWSKWRAPSSFQCASLVWYCAKDVYGCRLAPYLSPTVTPGNIFFDRNTYIKKRIIVKTT